MKDRQYYLLSEYFDAYGQLLHPEKWDENIARSLMYRRPINEKEIELKKFAKGLSTKIRKDFFNDIEVIEYAPRGRSFKPYYGYIGILNFENSSFVGDNEIEYKCRVLLKATHPLLNNVKVAYVPERGPKGSRKKWNDLTVLMLNEIYLNKKAVNAKQLIGEVVSKYAKDHPNPKLDETALSGLATSLLKFWRENGLPTKDNI